MKYVADKFKDYTDHCGLLLFYIDFVIFEAESIGIEIYAALAACGGRYGDFCYFSKAFVAFDQITRYRKYDERALRAVHRIYYHYSDGTDFYRIKAEYKDPGFDTGECHAGEETQRGGRGNEKQ